MSRVLVHRPGLKVTYDRRPSTALHGRFGGGWQWKVGVQASGELGTILVSLLVATITIDRRAT